MSRNKERATGSSISSAATAKERRSSRGRRRTDWTEEDIEMVGEVEKAIQQCTLGLEHAYERMERNREDFDRLKSESRIMLADTERIIETFQTA
jgi:hypothetical protein